METTLTNEELEALMRPVVQRIHADLFGEGCDCPLHRLSKEERAGKIDRAINEGDGESGGDCCYIGPKSGFQCGNDPEWRIVWGDGPDDYTESCTRHVGEMLTDALEHRIYPLKGLNTATP